MEIDRRSVVISALLTPLSAPMSVLAPAEPPAISFTVRQIAILSGRCLRFVSKATP